VHGHTSRIEEYEGIIAPFAREFRVIVPDLPGSGYSDKPRRRYTLAFYEEALLGPLDALHVPTAFVAGGSLGGNLALRLAHREPQRIARVAAWAPGGAWEPMHPWLAWFVRMVHRPMLQDLLFWPTLRYQSRFWYEPTWAGKARALREAFAYYREVHSPGFVRMYWEIAYDQLVTSLFPLAPGIRQPVQLLWGDRDHGMNMGAGVRKLLRLLPDARLYVLPGVRHSIAAEAPDELVDIVSGFLTA
jgi:pimeloyl-ACP methyl ester carboxylesterase